MTPIGIIFDMDGVIIDNNHFHYETWKNLCARYNKPIDEKIYREKMNGRTLKELAQFIFEEELSLENIIAIGQQKEVEYRKLYQPYLKPAKGLLKLLSDAHDEGIPMVVGTSAPKENVRFIMEGLGIGHYFKAILDDRAVTKGKPNPEIYLKCAQAAGLPNAQCVVFEDAISGLVAGKAAGSKIIAVATSHRRDELHGDLIIDHFDQINLQQIKDLIRKQ
jgi:beta-phosphoglucomutase